MTSYSISACFFLLHLFPPTFIIYLLKFTVTFIPTTVARSQGREQTIFCPKIVRVFFEIFREIASGQKILVTKQIQLWQLLEEPFFPDFVVCLWLEQFRKFQCAI